MKSNIKNSNIKKYDYIIIGGGISGLYTAYNILKYLNSSKSNNRVLVIESNNELGGRISTYDSKGVIFEKGGARFGKHHTRFIKLLKELNLEGKKIPIPNTTNHISTVEYNNNEPTIDDLVKLISSKKINPEKQINHTLLELADKYLKPEETGGIKPSKYMENKYQYYSELATLNGKEALNTFKNDFNLKRQYYIFNGGLKNIIHSLDSLITKNRGKINKNEQLVEILGYEQMKKLGILEDGENLKSGIQTKTNNTFFIKTNKINKTNTDSDKLIEEDTYYQCNNLILAIPQQNLLQLQYLKPHYKLLKSVECQPLYRIYAKYPINKKTGSVWFSDLPKISTNSKLKFVIPYNYQNGLIMITYTDGKYARYWLNTVIKGTFDSELTKKLKQIFPDKVIPKPEWVKHYYWGCGAAYWKKGSESEKLIPKIAQPFKNKNLFICGENYSSHQAWMEGALQTADLVISRLKKLDKSSKNKKTKVNKLMKGGSTRKTLKKDHTKENQKKNKKINQKIKKISMDEVAKHNKKSDAWLVIDKKVYDITKWIPSHPGGDIIMKGVGKDATSMFNAIGHSNNAKNQLKKLYIGELS